MADIETPGPSLDELRAAGTEAHVARLQGDLDAAFGTTRRGRLALRLSRWYARRKATPAVSPTPGSST